MVSLSLSLFLFLFFFSLSLSLSLFLQFTARPETQSYLASSLALERKYAKDCQRRLTCSCNNTSTNDGSCVGFSVSPGGQTPWPMFARSPQLSQQRLSAGMITGLLRLPMRDGCRYTILHSAAEVLRGSQHDRIHGATRTIGHRQMMKSALKNKVNKAGWVLMRLTPLRFRPQWPPKGTHDAHGPAKLFSGFGRFRGTGMPQLRPTCQGWSTYYSETPKSAIVSACNPPICYITGICMHMCM